MNNEFILLKLKTPCGTEFYLNPFAISSIGAPPSAWGGNHPQGAKEEVKSIIFEYGHNLPWHCTASVEELVTALKEFGVKTRGFVNPPKGSKPLNRNSKEDIKQTEKKPETDNRDHS